MESEQTVKVMLNLHKDICERSQQLTGFVAKNSLRGSASRADVMRAALSIGLKNLEKEQVKQEAAKK